MLNDMAFDALCAYLELPKRGRNELQAIREGDPLRTVRSKRKNVSGRFANGKMPHVLMFESRVEEVAVSYEYEYDQSVFEIWDQAIRIKAEYVQESGKKVAFWTTVDFVLLTERGIFLDEWKTEAALRKLASKDPMRYVETAAGWISPPMEAAATRLGFVYRLRTPATIDQVAVANAEFLRDYLEDSVPVPSATRDMILDTVKADPGVTSAEILSVLSGAGSANDLNRMIVRNDVWVDLSRIKLAQSRYTAFFADESAGRAWQAINGRGVEPAVPVVALDLAPGVGIVWDGSPWTVVNVGATEIVLGGASGEHRMSIADARRYLADGLITPRMDADDRRRTVQQRFAEASPDDQRIALERHRILERIDSGERLADQNPRTVRNWRHRARLAEAECGVALVGLLPRRPGRSAGPQLKADAEAVIAAAIEEDYANADAPNLRALYLSITARCENEDISVPTWRTVRRRVAALDHHALDVARRGTKAAYGSQPFYWTLGYGTERHGDRPWQVCHIDHTKVDIEVVDSETGMNLGRPWLSIMVDAYSRKVLASELRFDPPSHSADAAVLDQCVEKHGRLPDTLIGDGGSDFNSAWYEIFLAANRVTKKVRPGEPRFGAVLERVFGTANSMLFHNLRGNTKATRNVRQMTDWVDPKKRAVWTLAELKDLLGDFLRIYHATIHEALGVTPDQEYEAAMRMLGDRPMRLIAYDETFRMSLLPTTDKGTAIVDRVRGVQIGYLHYRSDAFAEPGVHGTGVPVRYDPKDVRHAFAFVNGRWVEAICTELRNLGPMTAREMDLITKEGRASRGKASAARSREGITNFLGLHRRIKESEALLLLRRQDNAAREKPDLRAGNRSPAMTTRRAATSRSEQIRFPDDGHDPETETDTSPPPPFPARHTSSFFDPDDLDTYERL